MIADRIIFPKDQQRAFLITVKRKLNMSWVEIGALSGAHRRSFSDWVNEKNNMPHAIAKTLSKQCGVSIPGNVQIRKWKDHLQKIGINGGAATIKKYGRVPVDEKYRQQKWREWWEQIGKYQFHPIINKPLPVKKPARSEKLAEFVGIVLGDGGISKMQIVITHHRVDDKEHSMLIMKMIKNLFNIEPSTSQEKHALADNIIISRRVLVDYFVNELELKIGSKVRQQVDMPNWIKNNKKYLKACVRGLVDTDGCVFTHRYKVNGKWYAYKKLAYTSCSVPLKMSVYNYLLGLELKPRLAGESDVRIESQKDIQKYMKVVGSHNPKHLKRYAI